MIETLHLLGGKAGDIDEIDYPLGAVALPPLLRIRITFKLAEPIKTGIYLQQADGIGWVSFLYEDMGLVCYGCGRVGHNKMACKSTEEKPPREDPNYRYHHWKSQMFIQGPPAPLFRIYRREEDGFVELAYPPARGESDDSENPEEGMHGNQSNANVEGDENQAEGGNNGDNEGGNQTNNEAIRERGLDRGDQGQHEQHNISQDMGGARNDYALEHEVEVRMPGGILGSNRERENGMGQNKENEGGTKATGKARMRTRICQDPLCKKHAPANIEGWMRENLGTSKQGQRFARPSSPEEVNSNLVMSEKGRGKEKEGDMDPLMEDSEETISVNINQADGKVVYSPTTAYAHLLPVASEVFDFEIIDEGKEQKRRKLRGMQEGGSKKLKTDGRQEELQMNANAQVNVSIGSLGIQMLSNRKSGLWARSAGQRMDELRADDGDSVLGGTGGNVEIMGDGARKDAVWQQAGKGVQSKIAGVRGLDPSTAGVDK